MHSLVVYIGIREPSEVFYLDFCSGLYLLLFFWCVFLATGMDLNLCFPKIYGVWTACL